MNKVKRLFNILLMLVNNIGIVGALVSILEIPWDSALDPVSGALFSCFVWPPPISGKAADEAEFCAGWFYVCSYMPFWRFFFGRNCLQVLHWFCRGRRRD